jgi:hypothetical protein
MNYFTGFEKKAINFLCGPKKENKVVIQPYSLFFINVTSLDKRFIKNSVI